MAKQNQGDVSTELFEHDKWDPKGGHVRIHGPGEHSSLKNFQFEGVKRDDRKKVSGRSRSLTVADAWLTAFAKEGFGGDRRYFGPGTRSKDLKDIGLGNEIRSLKLAAGWDSPELPGIRYGQAVPCWLEFPPTPSAVGEGLRFEAPVEVPRFTWYSSYAHYLQGHTFELGSKEGFRGLKTGPQAWVELFPEEDFRGDPLRFEPDTVVRDLSPYYPNPDKPKKSLYKVKDPAFKSLKLYDREPEGWPGASVLENHLLLEQMGLKSARFNQSLRGTTLNAVSKVPEIGGGLKLFLGTLWPDGKKTVWKEMRRTMDALLEELLDKIRADRLEANLDKIYGWLKDYSLWSWDSSEKGSALNTLIQGLIGVKGDFMSENHPEKTLTYFVPMATVMLGAYRERWISFEHLYPGDKGDIGEKKRFFGALQDLQKEFQEHKETGRSKALKWRLGKLEVVKADGTYYVADYVSEERSRAQVSKAAAEELLAQQKVRVQNEYEAQLDDFLDTARLWPYFDQEEPKPVKETAVALSGPFGGVPTSSREPFEDDNSQGPITGLRLYGGSRVDGIEVFYGGHSGGLHGQVGGDRHIDITLEGDEVITSAYGRAGQAMDQLVFRTSTGREFGVGGAGGVAWSAGRPHANARLAKISGLEGDTSVEALTFHWAYERYS